MTMNRRDFMKAGGLASAALGLNLFSPAIFQRRLLAGGAPSNKKMVFIFQRGGSDGINTVIPRGDSEYNTTNRPTLYIPEGVALDLGNGFAQLHPMMDGMMSIYNSQSLTGVDGPGNLAVLHRIGYSGQSQSHFDSQQYWENGQPGQPYNSEGMLYRKVVETLDPTQNRFAAAAISGSQMVALNGQYPLPTLRNAENFTLEGSASQVNKLLGSLPTFEGGGDGKGLLGLYGGPRDFPGKFGRNSVYGTGLALVDAIRIVQDAVAQGTYTPANGAVYPNNSHGDKLQEVAMLLKRTPVQILGVNIGGWDTHTNQTIYGNHGNNLQRVADGFQALYLDLQDQWEDLVIVTMTEFGRTSRENGSFGTDHANACAMFVGGGGVTGGVYNCDSSTWADGDMFSRRDRYLERVTDYRAVFAEIFTRHFGDSMADVQKIIPSYESAAAANPSDFEFLNFMA